MYRSISDTKQTAIPLISGIYMYRSISDTKQTAIPLIKLKNDLVFTQARIRGAFGYGLPPCPLKGGSGTPPPLKLCGRKTMLSVCVLNNNVTVFCP